MTTEEIYDAALGMLSDHREEVYTSAGWVTHAKDLNGLLVDLDMMREAAESGLQDGDRIVLGSAEGLVAIIAETTVTFGGSGGNGSVLDLSDLTSDQMTSILIHKAIQTATIKQ